MLQLQPVFHCVKGCHRSLPAHPAMPAAARFAVIGRSQEVHMADCCSRRQRGLPSRRQHLLVPWGPLGTVSMLLGTGQSGTAGHWPTRHCWTLASQATRTWSGVGITSCRPMASAPSLIYLLLSPQGLYSKASHIVCHAIRICSRLSKLRQVPGSARPLACECLPTHPLSCFSCLTHRQFAGGH